MQPIITQHFAHTSDGRRRQLVMIIRNVCVRLTMRECARVRATNVSPFTRTQRDGDIATTTTTTAHIACTHRREPCAFFPAPMYTQICARRRWRNVFADVFGPEHAALSDSDGYPQIMYAMRQSVQFGAHGESLITHTHSDGAVGHMTPNDAN